MALTNAPREEFFGNTATRDAILAITGKFDTDPATVSDAEKAEVTAYLHNMAHAISRNPSYEQFVLATTGTRALLAAVTA